MLDLHKVRRFVRCEVAVDEGQTNCRGRAQDWQFTENCQSCFGLTLSVCSNHAAGDPGAAVAGWVGKLIVFCGMDDHCAAVCVKQGGRARREGRPVACGIR